MSRLPKLPKCPFRARCYETAKKEAYNQHTNCKCSKDQVEDFVISYLEEEMRKVNQASLAVQLDKETSMRLMEGLRQSDATDTCSDRTTRRRRKFVLSNRMMKKKKSAGEKDCFDPKLQMDKNPAELIGVTIFPNQGGETIVGTLEAHAHGFVYATSNSHMHFMYRDVEEAFFRVEDEKIKMPPLLHFHLKHPIKVGKEKTKDIEFRLVSIPVGLMISDDNSYKTENENQTRDWGRDKDLKDFVDKVQAKWTFRSNKWTSHTIRYFFFDELHKKDEFHGVLLPSKESAFFVLPTYWLVVVADTGTIVVNLYDIEIVHLAKLRTDEIDMTVVFKDFKRDLLEINSIPLHLLDGIKERLDFKEVKYYVNAEKPDWKSIVKGIVDSPETFLKQGGWKSFDLEEPATMRYYLHYILEKPKEWDSYDLWG
ncbi:hypothetical protein MKW92_040136 [Papaver armeniacum]|nr:hypothetical protein MKW92_040136 [Papaver armeniacum]